MTNARHNTIDYIEIGATDMAVSRAFYATVFDWQFTEYGPSYLGIQHPSAPFPDGDGVLARSSIVAIKRDDNAVFG